jgi:ribonuclease HI
VISPSGMHSKYAARLAFKATNNIAEYKDLTLGLNEAKNAQCQNTSKDRFSDSGRAGRNGIHNTRARIGQIPSKSKGP